MSAKVESILVRGPNWTGDLVMSTPGFRALRAAFPGVHLTLHVRPGLEPLLAGAPWFDEILPVCSYHAGPRALLREAAALRARGGFDLGLCVPDSWSSALLMRASGTATVVGYRGGGRGLLLHRAVAVPPEWGRRRMVSRERFVLGLVAALGCEERGTHLELFTTVDEESRAEKLLRARGIDDDEPLVALAPGASYGPSKLWPAESFAHVGDRAARAGARVLILGSESESVLVDRIAAGMREPAVPLAGALDLGSLKAVVRRTAAVVCNDAGARHVAVAFGVPCVVMMGPTSLEKTDLNLSRVHVMETEVACRPCYKKVCPIDHRCMTRLEPERVASVVSELLGRAPRDPEVQGRRGAENAEC